MKNADILIVGGGIGGLTAAISLIKKGQRVRVFEQAKALREVGAGVTLGSGAMRCMELLQLDQRVTALSMESVNLQFRHFRSGELLRAGFDTKRRASTARNARQIHRADLHALLAETLRALAPNTLELDRRLSSFSTDERGVTLQFANGDSANGKLLIGCDGVRSVVRDHVCGPQSLNFMGQVAFRCLVPMERARPVLANERGAVFIGPGCTFNRYPLRDGAIMNCVGLAKTDVWQQEGWNTPATNAEFLEQFTGWHAEVTGLIVAAPPEGIIKWGLFAREPLPRWSSGPATLLGDAAHPMLPFLGNGAVMAIEDALILARAVDAYTDIDTALARYEAARKPRTSALFAAAIAQGKLTQAQDPESYRTAVSPAHDPTVYDFDPLTVAL